MKRLTTILGIIAVLAVALVVAGVAILKSLDFNDYRALIAENVKEATGRDLVIEGNLDLQISLTPSVAVDGVKFANAAWGSSPEMMTMESFAAEVELIPLLSGDVQVKRIVLQGVDVLLETDNRSAKSSILISISFMTLFNAAGLSPSRVISTIRLTPSGVRPLAETPSASFITSAAEARFPLSFSSLFSVVPISYHSFRFWKFP